MTRPTTDLFLGIEGGGSKARAIAECRGRLLARIEFTSLNPVDVGYAEFGKRMRALLGPLLRCFPGPPEEGAYAIHACAALAGVGRASVRHRCRALVRQAIAEHGKCVKLQVTSDADALVEDCLGRSDGIVLIAGTGSIAIAVRHPGSDRTTARMGGRGGILDEGSGFKLGLGLLARALRTDEGRAGRSVAVDLLCERRGITLAEVPDTFLPPDKASVASLAPLVLEACRRGDTFARALVSTCAGELVDMVVALRERAGLSRQTTVCLSGGLFRSSTLRGMVARRLLAKLPLAVIRDVPEPLLGTLRLARKL